MENVESNCNTFAGMTDDESLLVQKAIEVLGKYLRNTDVVFNQPDMVKDYLRLSMNGLEREQFNCLFLDSQHRLIADEVLFMGDLDCSPVYPRVVVQKALQHNCKALILAHNHPSGVDVASRADKAITQRLVSALALVDIKVLDHIIVGDRSVSSFAELGLL